MTLTLLQPNFLRVDGSWVRLLELKADVTQVGLSRLGDLWKGLLPQTQPEIAEPLADYIFTLARNELDIHEAIAKLDELATAQFQSKPFTIRIASGTDQGPSRDHNEDTCYPDPKKQDRLQQNEFLRDRVAVICDGLGGHEGGEVASSMAIQTIEQLLPTLLHQVETDPEPFSPQAFSRQLESIVRVVNDQIVSLNDKQQRTAQQRMGTTLVMAVVPRPQGKSSNQVYIVHVGDSRIYWVSPQNCRQVTLDDDVATRESVLGYNFYIYSHQRVDGGALIQALGTRGSDSLVPRVQRFQIDEDCLLLLCSDGLSDFERVNELYERRIQPILTKNLPLGQACQTLIAEANSLNGHDNVTVALMRCRLAPPDTEENTSPDDDQTSIPTEIPTVPTVIPMDNPEVENAKNIEENIEDNLELAQSMHGLESEATDVEDADDSNEADDILDADEESDAPQQTSRSLIISIVIVMFFLGCGIAATQTPPVKQWLQEHMPQLFPSNPSNPSNPKTNS